MRLLSQALYILYRMVYLWDSFSAWHMASFGLTTTVYLAVRACCAAHLQHLRNPPDECRRKFFVFGARSISSLQSLPLPNTHRSLKVESWSRLASTWTKKD